MPLPAATYDATQTVVGRQSILVLTPSSGDALNLLVSVLEVDAQLDLGRNKAPGASNGVPYTARVWEKGRAEMLKVETEELEKVNAFLGSLSGKKDGNCTAYIRDPDDAANTVAYKTDNFACSIYRDPASIRMSGDDTSKATIIIESRKDGPITFTKDASTA
jgi:hypothetical protein